jgi:iron complex outermembrane recepter protein
MSLHPSAIPTRRTALLLAATALSFAAMPSVSFAAGAEETAIADIVVTASRRAEAARDVPVAVSVLSGEKLNVLNSSGLDVRFLSGRVPSLLVESSFGRTFPRFYIRGLGNTDFDPNAAQPVSVVYDNVALENPMLKAFPVFDVANIEVLRGPQGTLFGRNTPAGVVKITSARPDASALSGQGSISWGSYNTVNAEAALNVPLGGGFAARFSGLLQRRDDWVENTATGLGDENLEGYRDLAGRFQLSFESDVFNALANVHARDLDGTPRIFRAGIIRQGSNDFVPGFDKGKVALDGLTSQSLKSFGANLQMDVAFEGIGTLYSITAYEEANVESTGDIDGGNNYVFPPLGLNNALFPVNTGGRTKPKEFSQEFRFATEDMGGFRGQGGFYYFDQNLYYNETSFFPGDTTTNTLIEHDNNNTSWGLFASGEYKASEALTLRAGLRYSNDKKNDTVSGFAPAFAVPPGYLPVSASVSGDNLSWDLSATYVASDTLNLYARVATGYLGPAIQGRVQFGSQVTTAGAQTTISGEAGMKYQSTDRTIRFDLAGYWNSTNDLQLTAVGGGTNSARLLNADKAVGYGLEAELGWQPVEMLQLTASGSWNFTEIRDSNLAVAPCGSGVCTVRDPLNSAGLAIIDGNDLPQAPRFAANATARFGVPVGDGEVFAFTDWAYRSSINYFLYEASEFRGKPLLEGGLKIGYRTSYGLEASVFARNITNKTQLIYGIDFNNLTGSINEPRIIGVELRGRF